jgi:hypothetical protein
MYSYCVSKRLAYCAAIKLHSRVEESEAACGDETGKTRIHLLRSNMLGA